MDRNQIGCSRVDPWTQRYRLRWRPTLNFFEQRYAILRTFESEGLLRGFIAREGQVSARLGDSAHVVTLTPSRLEIDLLRPDADAGRLEFATKTVLEALKPERLIRPIAGFQWLLPVDKDYDEARAEAATRVFPMTGATTVTEWAFLIDGRHEDTTYRMEVGVVEKAEIAERLARRMGRVGAEEDIPPSMWPVETLPDVAFFGDAEWVLDDAPKAIPKAVLDMWSRVLGNATTVVSSVFDRLGAPLL
jgi:hypothetical protein